MGLIDYSTLLTAAVTFIIVSSLYFAYTEYVLRKENQAFMQAHGCQPARSAYPIKEPLMGGDFIYKIIQAARARRLCRFFTEQLNTYGNTYTVTSLRGHAVHTNEPENLKAAIAVNFDDWSARPGRLAFEPLMQTSIFMSDGPQWSHARAIIRPIFAKDQVSDLSAIEQHVQALLRLIPSDGSTVELQELFHRFTLDTSTEFLFGQSTHSLRPGRSAAQARLDQSIAVCLTDALDRSRYGILYPLFCRKDAAGAIAEFHNAVDGYVQGALERTADGKEDAAEKSQKARYSFLDELARNTRDRDLLRGNAVTALTAGRDTTASLLSNMFFVLAREPKVWNKLRAEVDELEGRIPTYEWIRNAQYLRYTEHEVMRLYQVTPLLPPRVANKNTVLPLGGGLDGKSPMFVPKGTKLLYHVHSTTRRKDLFGEDADEFNPDRWATLRPGWNYTPFGGGPRICIGQQFALTEAYYVTVRLMQHFRRIEARDPEPWTENMTITLSSLNGVKVGLFPE